MPDIIISSIRGSSPDFALRVLMCYPMIVGRPASRPSAVLGSSEPKEFDAWTVAVREEPSTVRVHQDTRTQVR